MDDVCSSDCALATHNLEVALALSKLGIVIIPCRPNKVPYLKNWPAAGSKDESTIHEWWWQFPDAIPGIPCGTNGLLVVDADRKNGVDGVTEWACQCKQNGFDLGKCFSVETPSGGRHYYFRQAPGSLLGNTVAKIAAGVDTRGDGGQVIAPGAMLPDGRSYRVIAGALTATPVIPDGLRIFLTELEGRQPACMPANDATASLIHSINENERAYGLAALQGEALKVREAPQGTRNNTLNASAFSVGTLIPHYGLSREEAEAAFTDAALTAGLERDEIAKTLKSGLDEGMKSPRPPLPISEILDGVRDFVAQGQLWFNKSSKAESVEAPCALKDGAVTRSDWPAPKPLPPSLPPVDAFDPAFLPATIASWVMDISERMQCPPDFVAVSVMVALGSTIGRQVGIRPKPKDDWTVMPNLWGMIVGRPGVMKSPAMGEAIAPLRRLEAQARKEHQTDLSNYRIAVQEYELRVAAAKEIAKKELKQNPSAVLSVKLPDELAEPKPKRFIVTDVTYEALGDIHMNNPNGLLTFRDELISLLKTLDKEEYVAARGFYLSGWSGTDGYTFDRIGRGHQHIEAVCLSVLGSTQPGRLATYIRRALRGGDGDDGMIQRFGLLVWPDQSSGWRHVDRFPDSVARQTAAQVFDRLSSLNASDVRPNIDRFGRGAYLGFNANAATRFLEWLTDLELRLRAGKLHVALESHLGKYRKLVPALALINQLTDAGIGPVTVLALDRAIAFTRYLETHARRAYGAGLQMEAMTAVAILAHIRNGDLADGFTLRDIHQRDWSTLTDREQVQAGLDLLVDHDWLAVERIVTGGRPKNLYLINPKARL